MNNKERILLLAHEKFFKEGFYKVSMDELARELRMSKKTIYKHFVSKESLMDAVVDGMLSSVSGKIDEVVAQDISAIGKILGMFNIIVNLAVFASEKWLNDIKIHAPELWTKIDTFRTQKMRDKITRILDQGKKEGVFEDKPTILVHTIFITSVRAVVNPDFILNNNMSFRETMETTFGILLNGIFTEKGKMEFKNLKNGINK
ncbi:MAG: TetR/AcrR family transcriptional regulator [Ignavibacteriales bacterium]